MDEIKKMNNIEFNDKTLQVSKMSLDKSKIKNPSIILIDRGIIDNYFWYQMMYNDGILNHKEYKEKLSSLKNNLTKIDQLFVMTADPEIIIYRDYINQLYLEDRRKTTIESVSKLKEGFDHLLPAIKKEKINVKIIEMDTTNKSEIDTSIDIANSILDTMKIKILKNK